MKKQKDSKNLNIAFVYDRVNKMGGAERVLMALHDIWPEAPLFTAVYAKDHARWAKGFTIIPSFLNRMPFARLHHEWFAWLTPFAFASFNFDAFDVVLSVTSAEAKNCITKPETLHICYCLTPTRYLWSGEKQYREDTGFGLFHGLARWVFTRLTPLLQSWDLVASKRPDVYVAISNRVGQRIRKYYHIEPKSIIYPPVDSSYFQVSKKNGDDGYYLVVSRLVPYKRIDLIVKAIGELKRKLVIVGSGSELKKLQKSASPAVQFISENLTDAQLLEYYQRCRAFLFAADEDFGIVTAEAQCCGKPVIAYKQSGVSEIVIDGKTGILFQEQTVQAIKDAILLFETKKFNPEEIRKNGERFSIISFQNGIKRFVEKQYQHYNKSL